MLDIRKFKIAIEDKIRFVEESASNSVLEQSNYAYCVGHKFGLKDALLILNDVLGETAEREEEDDVQNTEDAG